MIEKALDNLPLADIDLLFIENVGNLICPAEFDLGEHRKVVLASTPEGDDKPYKYPLMFTGADVVVVTKIDLSPHLDFRMTGFREAVTALNPDVKILPVSAKTGKDLERWFSWLLNEARSLKKRRPNM
jgi:hydrogenase nickel incorporation protein HypB